MPMPTPILSPAALPDLGARRFSTALIGSKQFEHLRADFTLLREFASAMLDVSADTLTREAVAARLHEIRAQAARR